MSLYKRGNVWWYRFEWEGREIRLSSKSTNKRTAEQVEAAHKTSLAKGEVGIKKRLSIPTLREFAELKFSPFVETKHLNKPKTLEYYRSGIKNLTGYSPVPISPESEKRLKTLVYAPLAHSPLDEITVEQIGGFIETRRAAKLEVSSINRQLEVLRRMFKLALEWLTVEKVLPKVEMLPGEKRRERVLSYEEEERYLEAAKQIGDALIADYEKAHSGIRATMRAEAPIPPRDPFALYGLSAILIDCGLRPEEAYRLQWSQIRDAALHIPTGKSENARRSIPMTQRVAAIIEMRRKDHEGVWVFPAPTQSGHLEKSSLRKQHEKAYEFAAVEAFTVYTFRHTCLTNWASHMDPYTLAYLAGHADFSTTKRYVHPETKTVINAIERARNARTPHKSRHSDEKATEDNMSAVAVIQ